MKWRSWDTYPPGTTVKWGDNSGIVLPFDKAKAEESFDSSTELWDHGASKGMWQYILVRFTHAQNPSLSADWDTFVPMHQLKPVKYP